MCVCVCVVYICFTNQALRQPLQNNFTSSENVSYDTVGRTVNMSTQDNMTFSENISYATVNQVNKETDGNIATSYTAVYDEVQNQ